MQPSKGSRVKQQSKPQSLGLRATGSKTLQVIGLAQWIPNNYILEFTINMVMLPTNFSLIGLKEHWQRSTWYLENLPSAGLLGHSIQKGSKTTMWGPLLDRVK